MKRFLIHLGLFLLLQAVIALALYAGHRSLYRPMENFLAATPDKEAAARSAPAPRLLIVGGSSAAFGFDCKALSRELGVHALNLGLHAGLGTEFVLNQAAALARPGDLVLLGLEYEQYEALQGRTELLLDQAETCPHTLRYWNWTHWKTLLDRGLAIRAGAIVRSVIKNPRNVLSGRPLKPTDPANPYARAAFDSHGDTVAFRAAELDRLPPDARNRRVVLAGDPRRMAGACARLETFHAACGARNIRVAILYPPAEESALAAVAVQAEQLDAFLRANLTIPVLNTPRDSAQPFTHFFDTVYHLNSEGVAERTPGLVRTLRPWVDAR
jgi:hypothetical protein